MDLLQGPGAHPHVGEGGRPRAQHLAGQVVALPGSEVVELSHDLSPHGRDCERDVRRLSYWSQSHQSRPA